MHTHGIRDDGLDDVAVGAGEPDRVRTQPGVPVAYRRDRAILGVAQSLPVRAGEDHRARLFLDGPPQRVLGQRLHFLTGPVAVTALPETVVDDHGTVVPRFGFGFGFALVLRDRQGCLLAALQRAGDDRGERYRGETLGQGLGLLPTAVVETDTRGPSEQDGTCHRGESMADEQDGGHRTSNWPGVTAWPR